VRFRMLETIRAFALELLMDEGREAGARRDLGEIDAALRTLENAPLRSQNRADWTGGRVT